MIKLDLACGKSCAPGFEGVDRLALPGVVHLADLNLYPWWCRGSPEHRPHGMPNDSVDELFSSHYVEHAGDLVRFMEEAYRILKSGAKFTIRHPYQFSLGAWQDPTHVRALNEMSWWYYNAEWREKNLLDHYDISCDFDYPEALPVPAPEYQDYTPEAFQKTMHKFNNVCLELQVTLIARKGNHASADA